MATVIRLPIHPHVRPTSDRAEDYRNPLTCDPRMARAPRASTSVLAISMPITYSCGLPRTAPAPPGGPVGLDPLHITRLRAAGGSGLRTPRRWWGGRSGAWTAPGPALP